MCQKSIQRKSQLTEFFFFFFFVYFLSPPPPILLLLAVQAPFTMKRRRRETHRAQQQSYCNISLGERVGTTVTVPVFHLSDGLMDQKRSLPLLLPLLFWKQDHPEPTRWLDLKSVAISW